MTELRLCACIALVILKTTQIYASFCNITINISSGELHKNGSVLHNGVLFLSHHVLQENNQLRGCICEYKSCVRKCCYPGQHYNDSLKCVSGEKNVDFKIHELENETEDTYHLIHAPEPEWCDRRFNEKYMLEPDEMNSDVWKVQKNGEIYLPNEDESMNRIEPLQHCAEHYTKNNQTIIMVCVSTTEIEQNAHDYFTRSIGLYIYSFIILSY